jgi:hypothetical protein
MTLYQYLNLKEFNLFTDNLYAYSDKLALFKPKHLVDNVSTKLTTKTLSLSQQLQIPIVLITTPIPENHQIPHLIIRDKYGSLLYSEHIIEKPNRYSATTINNQSYILKVRGLMIRWKFHPAFTTFNSETILHRPKEKLLTPDKFNTIYPDKSKFNLYAYGEIEEQLPKELIL